MESDATPIIVGRFGKTFGVSGWLKINSFTDPKENILNFKHWLIKKNNLWQEISFASSKKQADNIIIKLPNCNSPEEAALFTNIEIGVLRKNLPKLKKDEYYWNDLVGLKVINKQGLNLGIVKDLMATGANDVLVVAGEKNRLIPYLSHVIQKIDLDNKIIHVDWEEDF